MIERLWIWKLRDDIGNVERVVAKDLEEARALFPRLPGYRRYLEGIEKGDEVYVELKRGS